MSPTATARELHERLEQAAAVSAVAHERAARALAAAADVHAQAQRLILISIDIRARRPARPTRSGIALEAENDHRTVRAFRIEGVVGGVAAHARWSAQGLECSPALLQRIEIVVAMGETFDPGGGRPLVQASLDGPLKSVLPTVIRAFSSVTSIELAVGQLAPGFEAS
jgi:hypothetical protein